jgi:hypothetical protein
MDIESTVDKTAIHVEPAPKIRSSRAGLLLVTMITAGVLWVAQVMREAVAPLNNEWTALEEDFKEVPYTLNRLSQEKTLDHRELLVELREVRSKMQELPYSTKWDLQLSKERSVAALFDSVEVAIRSLEIVEHLDTASPKAHRVTKHVQERLRRQPRYSSTPEIFSKLAMEDRHGWQVVKSVEEVGVTTFTALFVCLLLFGMVFSFRNLPD